MDAKKCQVLGSFVMASKKMQKAVILMVTTNLNQREIAKKLGVNETTVSKWKRSKEFDELYNEKQNEYLKDLSAPALRTMKDLLNARSELVRFNAAKDILDRTGFKPADKIDMESDLTIIFEDDYGE